MDDELAFFGHFETAAGTFGQGGCVITQTITYSLTVGTLEGVSSTIMTQTTAIVSDLSFTVGTLLTSQSLNNDGAFTGPATAKASACVSSEVVFTATPTNVDYSVS